MEKTKGIKLSEIIARQEDKLKNIRYLSILYRLFRFFLLIGICFVFLFPVLYMISNAIRTPASVNDPGVIWIPKEFTLDNFKMTIDAMDYWNSLIKTMSLDVVSASLQVITCSFVGYGFARFRFKEKGVLFAIVIFTIIVPPQTTMMSSFVNFRFFSFGGVSRLIEAITDETATVNLLNTNWTFYLPAVFGMGIKSGLVILIFRQFFRGMPKELEESARIDGCGALRAYLRVIVPSAGSVFLTAILFSIVWYWNDYYLSAMYFSDHYPLSVALSQLRTGLQNHGVVPSSVFNTDELRTYVQAGALLTILPLLVMYVLLQRFFTESIVRSGIVG